MERGELAMDNERKKGRAISRVRRDPGRCAAPGHRLWYWRHGAILLTESSLMPGPNENQYIYNIINKINILHSI
jgi:hypothetical protein